MQEVGVITKIKQNTPTKFSHYNINSFITSHLLGRILIMVMYFLINQTKKVYAKKKCSGQCRSSYHRCDHMYISDETL